MMRLFHSTALGQRAFEGAISSTVALSGSTARPHIRGAVVLDETKVELGAIAKPVGPHATVEFEGVMPQATSVKLHRIALVLPSLTIPAKGTMQFGNGFMIDMAVATGTVSVSSLPEWISKGGLEAGNLEVSLDVKGKEADWKLSLIHI